MLRRLVLLLSTMEVKENDKIVYGYLSCINKCNSYSKESNVNTKKINSVNKMNSVSNL